MDTSKYCNFKTIFTCYILNYCSKLQFNKHTYKYKRKGNDQEINETIDTCRFFERVGGREIER